MSKEEFKSLNLCDKLMVEIGVVGYKSPTEVQCLAIPPALQNRDLMATADTGSGKTAAFIWPILDRLFRGEFSNSLAGAPTILILSPTRELAEQIDQTVKKFSKESPIKSLALYGGVEYGPQIAALSGGIDIVVATPGRLMDLMSQGVIQLSSVKIVVLDEADRLLEMGFKEDIELLFKAIPTSRQTLFFSATMPKAIEDLSIEFQTESVVRVRAESGKNRNSLQRIDQRVYFVDHGKKKRLLLHLLSNNSWKRVIVFTRTRSSCFTLHKFLVESGHSTEFIHGQRSQSARTKSIEEFKQGAFRILVATDLAARGIDIDELSCVINFDLPDEPELYIHRVGRTGRAGNLGESISFCDGRERSYLGEIERLAGVEIPAVLNHPYPARSTPVKKKKVKRTLESSWKAAAKRALLKKS
ncbi:DEAD/DEAH box helicase [Bdellovibrionales bacterium]|nr:DEAD/DEAH box helicase [Bdellovibrionales bacterium]